MEYATRGSGFTGVDMYGVEKPPFIGPAGRTPCQPHYQIVDKGSPGEDEHKRACQESRAF
jgi:hypothetical protein